MKEPIIIFDGILDEIESSEEKPPKKDNKSLLLLALFILTILLINFIKDEKTD